MLIVVFPVVLVAMMMMMCVFPSGSEMSQMDSSLSVQNSLKTVMGVCLCLLVVTAAPASHTVLGKIDPPTDLFSSEQTLALLHFLRSVLAYNRMRDSTSTGQGKVSIMPIMS